MKFDIAVVMATLSYLCMNGLTYEFSYVTCDVFIVFSIRSSPVTSTAMYKMTLVDHCVCPVLNIRHLTLKGYRNAKIVKVA